MMVISIRKWKQKLFLFLGVLFLLVVLGTHLCSWTGRGTEPSAQVPAPGKMAQGNPWDNLVERLREFYRGN